MCDCGEPLVQTVCTIVCTHCGLETRFLTPLIQTYSNCPQTSLIISPYSRKQRFVTLLRKIIGVDSGPPANDDVWHILSISAPFKKTEQIIGCLKNSGLKTKHYNNLHSFSKVFLSSYEAPQCHIQPLQIETRLENMFREVLFRWIRYLGTPSFFSYSWLLEKLMKTIYIFENYEPYVKVLVCPKRRQKYEQRWEQITKFPLTNSRLFHYDSMPTPPEIA